MINNNNCEIDNIYNLIYTNILYVINREGWKNSLHLKMEWMKSEITE